MAKQHFYSRVPARVSMYNRSDGFDTFAHSEGLERDFIQHDLSFVYENKLAKNDLEAVRKGLMPFVYSQCCLRSGELVQNCITYLPRDYTGERSAYLSHTLILSEEEKTSLLYSENNAPLNKDMFVTDISPFDLTSPKATASCEYAEKQYEPSPIGNISEIIKPYNPETVKSFMFAVLSVVFAKGKPIYFKLPCDDKQLSDKALKFIGAFISVLPFNVRENVSFVTYTTDVSQYSQMKIKAVSEACVENNSSKGVFIDFCTDLVVGLPADDVIAKAPVNFFYSLLLEESIRNEFLRFMNKAVKAMPTLEKLNMKTLSELVSLFVGASGLFLEEKIMPNDDAVYDFLCVFEKYRVALDDKYRRNAYKCLQRYPKAHQAIPKNTFSKLSKLYTNESCAAKQVAMDVVLELIHTDIMRDKLFVFIKNNYNGEDENIREIIHADLCRVFYGGFLQPQILDFFAEHFANEPEKTRNAVFEKLMLTIRTEQIQQKIVEFLKTNYDILTEKQKTLFYETFFEMLPECDTLSEILVALVNDHILSETEQLQFSCYQKIKDLLEKDSRKSEHRLLPLLCKKEGFCADIVMGLALCEWSTRKFHGEYLTEIAKKDVLAKVAVVVKFSQLKIAENLNLSEILLKLFENNNGNLYEWIKADSLLRQDPLSEHLRQTVVKPAIAESVADIFNLRLNNNGLEILLEYLKSNADIENGEKYVVIKAFLQLKNALKSNDAKTFFKALSVLVKDENKSNVADYIKHKLQEDTEGSQQKILFDIALSSLGKNILLSEDVYFEIKDILSTEIFSKAGPKANAAKVARESAETAAKEILETVSVATSTDKVFAEQAENGVSSIETFLYSFVEDYSKGADRFVLYHLSGADEKTVSLFEEIVKNIKPQSKGFFSKLFKK